MSVLVKYLCKVRFCWFVLLVMPGLAPADDFATRFEQDFVIPLVDQTPGGALVIVDSGEVVLQEVYGTTKASGSVQVTDQTLFRIASLSKTFASAAAAILVQDTTLTWQMPLQRNLKDLRFKEPGYGESINLIHLMSQSTGLMPHAYTNLIEENMSYRRIIDRLDRVDFVCEPGACYGYQNVVFSLVGDLVESQTESDYPAFVNARIFQPLDMGRASFGLAAFVNDADHAEPHVWTGKKWRAVKPTHHYYKVPPAAGVNASISDMREWLLAQVGQKPEVLHQGMLEKMHRGVIKTSRKQAHYPYRKALGNVYYGLGWRVFDYGGESGFVHHGGYVRGMRSEMVFNPETRTGMVFLTNSEPGGVNDLVFDFLDEYRKDQRLHAQGRAKDQQLVGLVQNLKAQNLKAQNLEVQDLKVQE
jgi:beta-lactamase class C